MLGNKPWQMYERAERKGGKVEKMGKRLRKQR